MGFRSDERGQVFLLTGVLLAMGFILLSTQLSLIASIGQQAGREVENPVLDDYLLMRRSLAGALADELRDADGAVACPADVDDYTLRVRSHLTMLQGLLQQRGLGMSFGDVAAVRDDPNDRMLVRFDVALTDGKALVQDSLEYRVVWTVDC